MAASTASRCLDLGKLDLRSTISGLQLQLSSLAQFATSIEDEVFHALKEQSKTKSSRGCLWIYRAASFRLVLGLRIANETLGLAAVELIETLTCSLREAKLWRQLRLSPTSIEASPSDTIALNTLTVHLAHDDVPDKCERRCLHKLGADVPYYDVQPPDGVPTAAVEAVHLAMDITQSELLTRKRLKATYAEVSTAIHSNEAFEDLRFASDVDASEDELLALDGDCAGELDMDAESVSDDALLEGFGMDGTKGEAAHDPASCHSSQSLKRTASVADSSSPFQEQHPQDSILQLIDAAVRLAISCDPTMVSKGIKVKYSKPGDSLTRLADMIPSLFSPTYLPAVSSRAVFLPTISHALSSVVGIDDYDSQDDAVADLSVRLWGVLQKGVYQPETARRLKPLSSSGNVAHHGRHGHLTMLDAYEGSQDSGTHYLGGELDIDLGVEVNDDLWEQEFDGFGVEDDLFDNTLYDALDIEEEGEFCRRMNRETGPLAQLSNAPSHDRNIQLSGDAKSSITASGYEVGEKTDPLSILGNVPGRRPAVLEPSDATTGSIPVPHYGDDEKVDVLPIFDNSDSLSESNSQGWSPHDGGPESELFSATPGTDDEDMCLEEILAI